MIRRVSGELEQARRLERGLAAVRWVGILLGVYLISQTNAGPPPFGGAGVVYAGQALMAGLALWNVAVLVLSNRLGSVAAMRRLGLVTFAVDAAVVFGIAWLNSYDPKGSVWVVIYILPLEGAVRYRLTGALAIVGVTFISEIGREAYLASRFASEPFLLPAVILRVGVQAIVALVAGFMARSLAREAENAAEQARRFQEAARRESLARRELAAFNTAILTGMAVEDMDTAIQLMTGAIGRDLGFESFSILLREEDVLVVKGAYGIPPLDSPIPMGRGVTGSVAAAGRALLVPDVSEFPTYIPGDPRVQAEMAAPMRIGEDVLGVVDVQGRTAGAFDDASLGLLTRLADQIALLIHSSRLHAQQKETLERLRDLDQMKSDFVAIASHELRTPLTAIHGYVTTLARRFDQLPPEEVQRFLETISRQSERMARLVEDLLLVSRIEAGTIRINALPAYLGAVLEDTVESLGPAERSRVRLEVTGADGPVEVDPDRLDQVLRNLIGNALKFSPPSSPVFVRAVAKDGEIRLAVTDRGVGIPPEHLPHVFDRFHQAG
ncbi:MAG TPA: histidine kinase dimerization/phospho-acceptor domain-containing protein, partial [Actinomycetota bacterium]